MKSKTAVGLGTFYLILYTFSIESGYSMPIVSVLYPASFFVIIGMVYLFLKDDSEKYPELGKGEEWGYRDKSKDSLGIF